MCLVVQSCPTLCDLLDCAVGLTACQFPPSMRNLQARIQEWVAMPSSRGSSQPRDRTQVSHIEADSLPSEPPGKPKNTGVGILIPSPGDLPDPEIKPGSPALQADSLPAELPVKPSHKDGDN